LRISFDAGCQTLVHVLTQFFKGLSSFFQLEIFVIMGDALSSDGELIGDRCVVFRAFERDQMLLHVV
jgi:hypothetical protein